MDPDTTPPRLEKELEEKCDRLAQEHIEVKRKKIIHEQQCIQYVDKNTGDILLVCADGSMLYTPYELGKSMNLKGFQSGFRTDPQALQSLAAAKRWEFALT